MGQTALEQIIAGIGCADFAARSSRAVRGLMGFDLAAMVLHRAPAPPKALFEDFGRAGFREGFDTYLRVTHRINPILVCGPGRSACRASDFRAAASGLHEGIRDHLVLAADEELGFRTLGWPRRLEEVGLYFTLDCDLVELSLYRERARMPASASKMRALGALRRPLAAALERHRALTETQPPRTPAATLSPREREVRELMLYRAARRPPSRCGWASAATL